MTTHFTATQVINERPRPRVLLYASPGAIGFDWVEARAATFKVITRLHAVDLNEWDLIVTDLPLVDGPTSRSPWASYRRLIPPHIYTFCVKDVASTLDHVFDFPIDENEFGIEPNLSWKVGVPGHRSRRVDNLPEPIQDLVQANLLPGIEARQTQEGIEVPQDTADLLPSITEFRPFLVGPNDLVYAASYRREGGSRHWVLPSDAGDLASWLDCAINEWHVEKPPMFPGAAAWQRSASWMTSQELIVMGELEEARQEYSERLQDLQSKLSDAELQLADLRDAGDSGLRRLIAAQDDALQDEVLVALVELGFDVEDMDTQWGERARREDYRVSDAAASGWLALGDATGTTKGAKASKVTALQAHLVKYLLEEKPETSPVLWLFINHLLHRDPNARGPLFTVGDVRVIKAANALCVDTSALFILVRACSASDDRKLATREWMRSQLGQITLTDAEAFVVALS